MAVGTIITNAMWPLPQPVRWAYTACVSIRCLPEHPRNITRLTSAAAHDCGYAPAPCALVGLFPARPRMSSTGPGCGTAPPKGCLNAWPCLRLLPTERPLRVAIPIDTWCSTPSHIPRLLPHLHPCSTLPGILLCSFHACRAAHLHGLGLDLLHADLDVDLVHILRGECNTHISMRALHTNHAYESNTHAWLQSYTVSCPLLVYYALQSFCLHHM